MSDFGKISQVILLFIAIYALDIFIFEIPFWLFVLVTTIALAILDFFQSEHELKLQLKQIEHSKG